MSQQYHLANECMIRGQFKDAMEYYNLAMKQCDQKDLASVLAHRAQCQLSLNSAIEALADANRACKLDPSVPFFHHIKGMALFSLTEFSSAYNCFEKAYELNPSAENKSRLWSKKCLAEIDFESAVQTF